MSEELYFISQLDGIWLRQPVSNDCKKYLHLHTACEDHEIWEVADGMLYILFWPPCGTFHSQKPGIRQFLIKLPGSNELWDMEAVTKSKDTASLVNSLSVPVVPYHDWAKRQIVVDTLTVHQQLVKERTESLARHVTAFHERRSLDLEAMKHKQTMRAALLFSKGKPVTVSKFCHLLAAFGFWTDLPGIVKDYLLNEVEEIGNDGTVFVRGVHKPVQNQAIGALAISLSNIVTAVQLAFGSIGQQKDVPMNESIDTKTYYDENDAHVFVSSGISGGSVWMTVRRKKASAGTHRLKSPALPLRDTREEAQRDLEAFAAKKGWKEA